MRCNRSTFYACLLLTPTKPTTQLMLANLHSRYQYDSACTRDRREASRHLRI